MPIDRLDKEEEEVKDSDNIYIYEEEDSEDDIYPDSDEDTDYEIDPDDSPLNYSRTADSEDIEEPEGKSEKKVSAFGLLIYLMLNPVQGWKKLRRAHLTSEQMQSRCFYPLLAILALSEFAEYFYLPNVNLSEIVSRAAVAFVSYFFGYFCCIIILKAILPKDIASNYDTDFGKVFIIVALSTLTLFSILTNLIPMLWPVFIFLPLWTIYLISKGIRFFKLTENGVLKFTLYTCIVVIGIPILLDWGLNELLPANNV